MKKTTIILGLLLLMAQGAWAASVAQAVLLSDNTMHFLYGEQLTKGGTYNATTISEVWNIPYVGAPGWATHVYTGTDKVTKVTFDASFASYSPTDCGYWLEGFSSLTTIENIQYLNTEQVTSMYDMFADCSLLTTLDLRYFDTSKVTDMRAMFKGCSELTTIYVGAGWTTANVEYSSDMFTGCTKLKGGNGTTYNADYTNKEYARIDAAGTPGYLTGTDVVVLSNDADNTSVLTTYKDKQKNVMLAGRTFFKDGCWNTLCLPFNLTISGSVLDGATVKELNTSTTNLTGTTLTLNFTTVSTITAGKPYIIKWDSGTNLVNPVFSDVTISSTAPQTINSTDGKVSFVGTYAPYAITSGNIDEIIYLGSANKIGYALNARTLRTCRAHFQVPVTAGARSVSTINFYADDVPLVIQLVQAEADSQAGWYTLQGRRLSARPTTKGIYIHQGKREIIK